MSRSGKPYHTMIFTIHKLIALGTVIYLAVSVFRLQQSTPLSAIEIAATALTLIFFIALFVTGGLLSAKEALPSIALKVHQIVPALTILSTAATLYLLLVRNG